MFGFTRLGTCTDVSICLTKCSRRIDADLATYPDCRPLQVILGDYVDRGPSSRTVLDRLIRALPHPPYRLPQRQS